MKASVSSPVAFVFPGQGSQFPGMGRELDRCGQADGELVAMAEETTGLPVSELMMRAPATTIANPEIAQVLVFVWSLTVFHGLARRGFHPAAVAGHSVGEYAALTACGSLDQATALSLVACRGRLMAEAALRAPGTMASIVGLDYDVVQRLCRSSSAGNEFAVIANQNSPRQVVVSGTLGSVSDVVAAAREAGAIRTRQLAVGGAYHSPLMDCAGAAMTTRLASVHLRTPGVPLVSSATGRVVTDIPAYRADLMNQLTGPVRWQSAVGALVGLGVRTFVEVGPGKVLSGLGREMVRTGHHLTAAEAIRLTDANRSDGRDPRQASDTRDNPATEGLVDSSVSYLRERT